MLDHLVAAIQSERFVGLYPRFHVIVRIGQAEPSVEALVDWQKTFLFITKMPLADHMSLITGILQCLGQSPLGVRQPAFAIAAGTSVELDSWQVATGDQLCS